MSQGHDRGMPGGSWGDVAKLLGMGDCLLGVWPLRVFHHQLPRRPDREDSMPFPYLDERACQRWSTGQTIQDPIVGQVAIPAHAALFGSEAFPGKRRRQGSKLLLLAALQGALMGGPMHAGIDALSPGMRL